MIMDEPVLNFDLSSILEMDPSLKRGVPLRCGELLL